MTQEKGIYKCAECGNIVQVLFAGGGELVCCGKPMVLQTENTVDASKEKHYIMWIQLIADGREYFKYLKPGMKPEAEFCVDAKQVTAREYCNLHGLWKTNN